MKPMHIEFVAKISDRLDRVLRNEKFPGSQWMSRESISVAISQGMVKINGKIRTKAAHGILIQDKIEMEFPTNRLGLVANPIQQIEVLFEENNKDLLFLEKPTGLDSLPLRPWDQSTFANIAAATIVQRGLMTELQFESLADVPLLEGGLFQRLDKFTSGLIGIALRAEAKVKMRELIEERKFHKKYLAITLANAAFSGYRGRLFFTPKNDGKTLVSFEEASSAIGAQFQVEILKKSLNFQLVEVSLASGVRHIVRAGLGFLGVPILGDELYGLKSSETRYFLHASEVAFPWKGRAVQVKSPLPPDFVETIQKIGL